MEENIRPCETCGQETSFERFHEQEPFEGERTACCDKWVCPDCICWTDSDEGGLICKDCCKCYKSLESSDSSTTVSYSKSYLIGEDFFVYSGRFFTIDNEKLNWIIKGLGIVLLILVVLFILFK